MGMDDSRFVKGIQDTVSEYGKNFLKNHAMMLPINQFGFMDSFLFGWINLLTGVGTADLTPAFRSVISSMDKEKFPTLTYTPSITPSNPGDCASATYRIVGHLADGTSIDKDIDPDDQWSIYKAGVCELNPNHDMQLLSDTLYPDLTP